MAWDVSKFWIPREKVRTIRKKTKTLIRKRVENREDAYEIMVEDRKDHEHHDVTG